MRATHTLIVVVALMVGLATHCTLAADDSPPRRIIDKATPYIRPVNIPAASDVTMRSLQFRPRDQSDTHDTFDALDAFHATRLEWVYLRFDADETEKIQRVKQSGRIFGGASGLTSASDTIWHEDGTATKKHVIVDPAGKQVIVPHMREWERPPSPGCFNDPEFRKRYLDYLKRYIDAGVESMQRDDPGSLHDCARRGTGCFCTYCMAGFRDFLSKNLSKKQLVELGVEDVSSFDYRAYVRSKPGKKGAELAEQFTRFQLKANTEFLAWTKREMVAYAGHAIPYSCNNTSFQRWEEDYYQVFDFAISELMLASANPSHIYNRAQKARSLGKVQVFGSPKTLGKAIPDEQLTRLKRQVIATSYAAGGLSRVPWDIFNQSVDGKQRYFGKPEHFADLYAMVRASHRWLDRYCTAGAFGSTIDDRRYGDQPPIQIEQDNSSDVYAFLRAIPGDKAAPIVIHLVDWGKTPAAFVLRLRAEAFFPTQKVQINLRTPRPYEAQAHEQAEERAQKMRKPGERLGAAQAGAYESLVHETTLQQEVRGRTVTVRVPPVTPWAILIVNQVKSD